MRFDISAAAARDPRPWQPRLFSGPVQVCGKVPLVPEGEEDLPLAPLVEDGDEDLPLAKLEPAQEPDFAANGVLNMRGGGSGTVTAGGYSVSRGLEATQSTDSFYLVVVGPMVRLTVNVAGTPTMYFDGYIRGEGR